MGGTAPTGRGGSAWQGMTVDFRKSALCDVTGGADISGLAGICKVQHNVSFLLAGRKWRSNCPRFFSFWIMNSIKLLHERQRFLLIIIS